MSNKARTLSELVDFHNLEHAQSAQGWVIAFVGTRRVSYYGFKGEATYDEDKTMVYGTKSAASNVLGGLAETKHFGPMWRFSRLIAVADKAHIKAGQLPTVNGY